MVHVVVIGAYGSAGVAAAERLADAAEVDRLTLVDDGDPGGGLCILRGCMPSKELLSAAAHRYRACSDPRVDGAPSVDLSATVETKDEHIANFASHRRSAVEMLAERDGVEFVHDTARFVDDGVVAFGDRELDADYVVVATGSTVNRPDLDGLDSVEYATSADVLDAASLPDSGVVVGFGSVGVELAPYLAEAGDTDVTVIEHDDRPLDVADPAFGDELLDRYREEFGLDVLTRTHEQSVDPTDDGGVRLRVERDGGGDGDGDEGGDGDDESAGRAGDDASDAIEADELFVFAGRRPNLDGLGLDATSMDPGEGWVRDTMQTRADPQTFVVGDANGRHPILHVAKEEGHLAAENVRRHVRGDDLHPYDFRPHYVVFSGLGVYPYARVGHTEASASDAGLDYLSVTRDAEEDGVFQTKDAPEGLASLVVDAADGTVLGYQGLHLHADVMAKTMQVVVDAGADVRDLPDRAYHPTTPEILDGLFRDASDRLDG